MSRTIWIPDYGDSGSWYQPLQIPEPGESGYLSPAERIACARPGDPVPVIIAREQAIEEALASARAAEASGAVPAARFEDPARAAVPAAAPEAGLSGEPSAVRPEYLGWAAEPDAGAEPQALADDQLYVGMTRGREVPGPHAQAEAGWHAVWDAADSAVNQARIEAGPEPEAEL